MELLMNKAVLWDIKISVHKYTVYQTSVLSFPVLKLNCGVWLGKVTRLRCFMTVFQLHKIYGAL